MKDITKLAGKKVLLVEDDEFLASIIGQRFASVQSVFKHTVSGLDALSILKEGELPDVLILDLLLPGELDGFGLLDKMKANMTMKNVPVVVLSNLNRPQDIERAMKAGAQVYLIKSSVVPDEILEHAAAALG